ncbi:MAG: M81 family metallopeptidase [Gammaproteobacteria bacterium]|nr:M81 family metallopeptidase [Gammaproteobacteria bacterium]
MKCVVAMMQHETNTFSPLETNLQAFASGIGLHEPPCGQQAIEIYGETEFAFAGLLDATRQTGAQIEVPVTAYAEPGGKVNAQAFEFISTQICKAVARGCDALLLDLHGAMVTESYDDGEGELLKRIRAIAPGLPIAVALDFHANLTADMVENSTIIDGYRTYPHIDMYDTGKRAANSLFRILRANIPTKMCWRAVPMMTHMLRQTPTREPMKYLMEQVVRAVDNTMVFNASIFGGFPLADIPQVSLSVLTVESSSSSKGKSMINAVCDQAWEKRREFVFEAENLSASIQRAKRLKEYPVVIADHGDNSGAGGSADDMTVLGEMIKQGLDGIVAGPIWDPQAVKQLIEAGLGETVKLDVGGKTDVAAIQQTGRRLNCKGIVEALTDGIFTIQGPMQTGLRVDLGRSVLLNIGTARLLICEQRWEPYDPGCFLQAGIDVKTAKFILIKSRQHFRATFEQIAKHIVLAAGPGVCSSDYSQFRFSNLLRPVYPLDPDMQLVDCRVQTCHSDAL